MQERKNSLALATRVEIIYQYNLAETTHHLTQFDMPAFRKTCS